MEKHLEIKDGGTPVNMTSFIEAVRRADGSAQPQQLSPTDLHVALERVGVVVPYRYFGFN